MEGERSSVTKDGEPALDDTAISSTKVLGARLLREISTEEGSLEDLLFSLRKSHHSSHQRSKTNIPSLDALLHTRRTKTLAISGRPLPLIYHLIISLLSPSSSHGEATIALLDLTHLFSPGHLTPFLPFEELKHIHVFQPTKASLQATLDRVEDYMLYGDHESKGREWKGLFVLGAQIGGFRNTAGRDWEAENLVVSTGWNGWLRVEKVKRNAVGAGVSVEKAWADTDVKGAGVENIEWKGACTEGSFIFRCNDNVTEDGCHGTATVL